MVEPRAHRALLDAFGGLEREAAEVAAAHRALARGGARGRPSFAERIAAAQARGRLPPRRGRRTAALAPQPGEEDALADRRQAMMRAEKIAGDIAEAHETVAGSGLADPDARQPRPAARAEGPRGRRPARRGDRGARPGARRARRGDARARGGDRRGRLRSRANWSGPRSACSRSAPRRGSTASPVADLPALAERMAAALAALESGEERPAGARRRGGRGEGALRRGRGGAERGSGRPPRAARRRRSPPSCRR